MCLAIPYTITQISGDNTAKAVSNGVSVSVRLDLLEKPNLGDTILVHAGFAIQKLEQSEANELFTLWDEVRQSEANGG
ncbi:MAG: HypC/HybG/HupF family hydrogenase formation chaperone [Synergistaceae bacterium]|nr:HypC/HybG/HupF family hydrogenase formation chaperone [Synergistaceae bacterium]